jgi:hypothetical protein
MTSSRLAFLSTFIDYSVVAPLTEHFSPLVDQGTKEFYEIFGESIKGHTYCDGEARTPNVSPKGAMAFASACISAA